jgi:hypothetical protein
MDNLFLILHSFVNMSMGIFSYMNNKENNAFFMYVRVWIFVKHKKMKHEVPQPLFNCNIVAYNPKKFRWFPT